MDMCRGIVDTAARHEEKRNTTDKVHGCRKG